jgi:3-phosphoshikimate 1-carboxyvinyltransferase
MRLMAGIVAGHPFATRMTGDESLSARPMRRVIAPLELMGARVESADGRPPLVVHGGALHGIAHRPEVPSAQVKSAVLLAGLFADATTMVVEPAATRDHTERALATFGGTVGRDGLTISVQPNQRLLGRALFVPGDFSSAAFWFVAAAAIPGSRVEVEAVGLNPTRIGLLEVLRRYGAKVTVEVQQEDIDAPHLQYEPRGTVVVEHERTEGVTIEPHEVPGLIDELPALAALGAHGGEVRVRGAGELRVKESDRIATLVTGFRALGIDADEQPDGFVVAAPHRPPSGGVANARGDHRMAMAFAIASLAAAAPSRIEGADAVAISYPGFFDMLERLIA